MSECSFEIKSDPATSQVVWLRDWPASEDPARVSDRYRIVLPILGDLFDPLHHQFRCHLRSGCKLSRLAFTRGKDLDVGSTHIDSQHVHDKPSLRKSMLPGCPF